MHISCLVLQGIQKMRAAGRLAADVLEHAGTLVKVSFRIGSLHDSLSFFYDWWI